MITTETHGTTSVLKLEHGKANALDLELLIELERQLIAFEESPQRSMVLTGRDRIFGAGVDLYRLVDGGDAYLVQFLDALDRAFRKLYSLEKPVVAAVNGHAIAGGCILALACERRLMSAGQGSMGITELLVGVPFPSMALEIVRSGLAPHVVEDLLFSGRLCAPEECLRLGLVHAVVEGQALLTEALKAAAHLGAISSETYRMTKREFRAAALRRVDGEGAQYDVQVRKRWHSKDVHERIRQFMKSTMG